MALDEDWGMCRHCGTHVGSGKGVRVAVRKGSTEHTTVLCEDCASLNCQNCGAVIPLAAALEDDRRGGTHVLTCSRCEEDVKIAEMVAIHREGDPNYRKLVCGDCLDDISVPRGYRVVRDVAPGEV